MLGNARQNTLLLLMSTKARDQGWKELNTNLIEITLLQKELASLMDLCDLKNSELEPQYQKYRARVVLRGDTVKDDSGSCAVFTEQGS